MLHRLSLCNFGGIRNRGSSKKMVDLQDKMLQRAIAPPTARNSVESAPPILIVNSTLHNFMTSGVGEYSHSLRTALSDGASAGEKSDRRSYHLFETTVLQPSNHWLFKLSHSIFGHTRLIQLRLSGCLIRDCVQPFHWGSRPIGFREQRPALQETDKSAVPMPGLADWMAISGAATSSSMGGLRSGSWQAQVLPPYQQNIRIARPSEIYE